MFGADILFKLLIQHRQSLLMCAQILDVDLLRFDFGVALVIRCIYIYIYIWQCLYIYLYIDAATIELC